MVSITDLSKQLKQIFEPEDNHPDEDNICEELYSKTTKRLQNGRYEVQIPFKDERIEKWRQPDYYNKSIS
jgi:hypothetical protein